MTERAGGETRAHPEWLRACVAARRALDVSSNVLFRPPRSMDGVPAMRNCVVSLTGYAGARRRDVETMTRVLGGTFQKAFDRTVTHLVCYEHSGAKWEKAREFGSAHIVNHRWLEDSITRWARAPETAYTRSGKDEDDLVAQRVPDSEDDMDDANGQTSVVPDSVAEGAPSDGKEKSANDVNAVASKTPSTRKKGASGSALESQTAGKVAYRSPNWEDEARRGVNIATSVRNRIDPSLKRALQEGSTQPDTTFTGIVGSPNDVEAALGGRFVPSNSWFSFADDVDQEPLTDAETLDDFYNIIARGRRSFGGDDTDEKIRQIRAGELRFEVFDTGISEAREEELLQPGSGLIIQTLYSGTVVLVSEQYRDFCEEIVRLVDILELQQRQGPIGKWTQAMLRVETAKQPFEHGNKPGPNALMKTFRTYVRLAHAFDDVDQAQLFNEDGTLVSADTIITLPARTPGNLRGVMLKEVKRPLRDVLAGFYELLAGPTEPDPTQQPPMSQDYLSQIDAMEDEEEAEPEVEREPEPEPEPEPEEAAADPSPEPVEDVADELAEPAPTENVAPPVSKRLRATKPSTSKKEVQSKRPAKPKLAAKPKMPKPAEDESMKNRRAYITLSGFSSAGIKKYSSVVRRIGAVLCPGHEWESSTTHVIFGERGSRSIKFLAGAVAGASLLDVSYLDACSAAGQVLPVEAKYFWRGGRGSEMGLISPNASKHWSSVPGSTAFEGLSVAVVPFSSSTKLEQKMLDTVLRAGGASISSVSSKGDVCLTQAEVPDLIVSDQVNASSTKDVPRLEHLMEDGVDSDVVVVSSEFFKAWISTPETVLDSHCLFNTSLNRACVREALAKRGEVRTAEISSSDARKRAPQAKSVVAPMSEPPAMAPAPRKRKQTDNPAPSQQRQTRAKRAADAPLATRVRSRHVAPLADATNK